MDFKKLLQYSYKGRKGKIMVSRESIENQLKAISFNQNGWGRTEVSELPSIILPDEVIYECVNGIYEGGFALLVATNVRVLLIDKKPLNYLTVEDLRFDMINELDYSHRLIGAYINISAGAKSLRFTSLNQRKLRKLITHVQHCMAESKKIQSESQTDQKQHLERINQQLQTYLLAQHRQQTELGEHLKRVQSQPTPVIKTEPEISPELNDYLFAQGINTDHHPADTSPMQFQQSSSQLNQELYDEGMKEIFGKPSSQVASVGGEGDNLQYVNQDSSQFPVNPLKLAYSKIPQAIKPKAPHIEVTVPNGHNQIPATD